MSDLDRLQRLHLQLLQAQARVRVLEALVQHCESCVRSQDMEVPAVSVR